MSQTNDSSQSYVNDHAYLLSVLGKSMRTNIIKLFQASLPPLTPNQWFVLGVLLIESEPISADEVSRLIDIDKFGVSRAVSVLLKKKLVLRKFSKEDRRRSELTLSKKGRAVAQQAYDISAQYQRQILQVLTAAELRQFDNAIFKLIEQVKAETE